MAGVSVERFWRLTPAEIDMEIEGFYKRLEHQEYLNGLLCAVMAEPYRDKKKHPEPFDPEGFMPCKAKEQRQTWEEMKEILINSAPEGVVK